MDVRGSQGLPRVVEVCLAAVGLLFSAPLLAVAAIAIKLTSAGPVFFRQERVGKDRKSFYLFKLRTMTAEPGALVTSANDRRITPIGRTLRQLKIDELPQIWNVLRGEMSLVGPRPEVPELVGLEDSLWKDVLAVRPGLTDPVTLSLRNEEKLLAEFGADDQFYTEVLQPYKLRGYLDYLRQRTWTSDIRIICRTFISILFPQRADDLSEHAMGPDWLKGRPCRAPVETRLKSRNVLVEPVIGNID